MPAKKIHQNSITGEQGINLIQQVVLAMGFWWYPTGGVEAGIDGLIEIRDSQTGEAFNSIIQVQSKATINRFQAEDDEGFDYLCNERDLNYWLQGNAPVLLVVSRPSTNEAYWVSIKDYFNDLAKQKARKIHFSKDWDKFDENCKSALTRLALPRNSGIYFTPAPVQERLYSNLLRVSRFGEHIYSAETTHHVYPQMWSALNKLEKYPNRVWILHDKRIYSFHDLAKEPWRKVCDPGTIQHVPAEEWAFSTDDEKRRRFVHLIQQALRDKLGALGVRYNEKQGCYYFKANRDLSTRTYGYFALKSNTSRDVVKLYPNLKKPSRSYYRHSGFKAYFRLFDNIWYLEINPTYFFTLDGTLPLRFYEEPLKGIKRLEMNEAVLGQVIMWSRVLAEPPTLFNRQHPHLEFGELQAFDIDVGIHDELWLPKDDPKVGDADTEEDEHGQQLPLFNL